MRRSVTSFALLTLIGGVPVTAGAGEPECPTVSPPEIGFAAPRYIDQNRAGGEPVSIVAQDGSIIVSAHAGTTHLYKDPDALPGAGDFAVGYTNQTLNWRSADGGATWQFVGLAGLPAGPHTPTSTGFSDPDLTMDAGGRIYNVEIDLANVSVFSSNDDGQTFMFGSPISASGDRPWVTGGQANEVFLYVNLPQQLWRSTDGGLTFLPVSTLSVPITGKAVVDPLNKARGLIGPTGGRNNAGGIAISADDGQTWERFDDSGLGGSDQWFSAVAPDRTGRVYLSAAGGSSVTFNSFDRITSSWAEAVSIPHPTGYALWPWTVAGDDGRAAVAWLQTLAGQPQDEYHLFIAVTHNAYGTTVTCSDGSTSFVPPVFTVKDAGGRTIHKGEICRQGTTCNLDPYTDRRLGEFFSINIDHMGNVFAVATDTMLRNPLGGPKVVGNPVFIKQDSGDRLLATPDAIRETRCPLDLPVCP